MFVPNILSFATEGKELYYGAVRSKFASDYNRLSKIWESLSPDRMLDLYNEDYRCLSQVFESVRPASDNIGKLLWLSLGAQTTKPIHVNIHVDAVHQLEEFILDADVIEDIFNNPDTGNAEKLEKVLVARFKKMPAILFLKNSASAWRPCAKKRSRA